LSVVDRIIAGSLPFIPKAIVARVARPYIAGESDDDAMRAAVRLNQQGYRATVDLLGEHVDTLDKARHAVERYLELLEIINRGKIDSTVSLKLSQFGLKVDVDACYSLVTPVVERAAALKNFVRIDMEDSSCTSATIEVYRRLRRNHSNVGVAIQAYLRRTADDIAALEEPETSKPNIRLCKGVYVESAAVAYRTMDEINRNYLAVLERLLRAGCYVGIATHDERIVTEAERMIREQHVPATGYEFQMLLGVSEVLRARIHAAGHPLRVYIPFGSEWYAYSVRRLRENPRIAGYVLKAMLSAKL
jgi:proline dehydrogenase